MYKRQEDACDAVRARIEAGETREDGTPLVMPTCTRLLLGITKMCIRDSLMGFMTWEGYNYEDAVLLSERIVKEDVFTSIHIEEYDMEAVSYTHLDVYKRQIELIRHFGQLIFALELDAVGVIPSLEGVNGCQQVVHTAGYHAGEEDADQNLSLIHISRRF